MLTMRRFLVLVVCVALSSSLASAAESALTADFDVQRVRPADAVVVLRTLANTRRIVVIDDHTVRVWDDESKIAVARAIVGLIEKPADGPVATVQLADGTTVAIAALRQASAIDVLKALRVKLQIRRVATIETDDSSSSILVRDSNEQAQEALKLIAEMDGGSGTKRSDNP
jgi:type II secretory pathway component GspD/PulD (secretin)